jgi:CPA1 family monovalent cation:H+ antiporter
MPSQVMGRGWADVLGGIPLFAGLSKRHRNRIAAVAKTRAFRPYTTIVRAGDRGEAFYVVLDGTVVVKPPGKRAVKLGPGDFFGELALLDGAPRTASVEAQTEVTVMQIGRTAFRRTLDAEPKISVALLEVLAARLRAASKSASD